MGLVSAIKKIREVLIIEGLPEMKVGIDASFQNAPFPFFYMNIGETVSEYGALQANYQTMVMTHTDLIFGLHINNLPAGHEWELWVFEILEAITLKFMEETRKGTFEKDGEAGFEAKLIGSKVEFDQSETMVMCAAVLQIGAYQ